jgi:hypothetical protein
VPRTEVSIRRIHPLAIVGSVVGRPRSYPTVARFLSTVWTEFFYPQYRLRWFAKDRRIYSVSAAIDAEIPFRPEYYPKYLSFVSLWLKTLGFVRKTAGDRLMPRLLEFVSDMDRLYREAGAISRAYPTTTRRPPGFQNGRMLVIKAFDPHYHCLPSLHIIVVVYTYIKFSEWIPDLAATRAEADSWKLYLRREMLEIAESVLYVKQHSVSCIAASLFFVAVHLPATDEAFVKGFVESLFEEERDVPAQKIRGYVSSLYLEFMTRSRTERKPCREILTDFIRSQGDG